jgi:hypothetical protein
MEATGAVAGGTGQAEAGRPREEAEALDALRFGWGDAYLIGHDDERGWWAARRDKIGDLLTADAPDALRDAITENYAVKPVPREPAARDGVPGGRPVLGADPGALMTGSAEP